MNDACFLATQKLAASFVFRVGRLDSPFSHFCTHCSSSVCWDVDRFLDGRAGLVIYSEQGYGEGASLGKDVRLVEVVANT